MKYRTKKLNAKETRKLEERLYRFFAAYDDDQINMLLSPDPFPEMIPEIPEILRQALAENKIKHSQTVKHR